MSFTARAPAAADRTRSAPSPRPRQPDTEVLAEQETAARPRHRRSRRRRVHARPAVSRGGRLLAVSAIVTAGAVAVAGTAYAAGPEMVIAAPATLEAVVNNLRLWLIGILAAVATLFLTVGALRYVAASGDPGEVERAKSALKSAAIGYGSALLRRCSSPWSPSWWPDAAARRAAAPSVDRARNRGRRARGCGPG